MHDDGEVIALVLDDDQPAAGDVAENTGAHRLIREPDGRVALEPVETREDFERYAKDTGCFRRGRAIRDPETFEVIGYELEEVSPALTVVSG